MKAIVCHQYGSPDVLKLQEIDKPVVKEDDVLVRVHAACVNPADWHLLKGTPYLVRLMTGGLLKPKHNIPGIDMAGQVEAVGGNVKQFQPGDEVFGGGGGAFAEYACLSEDALVLKPANLTFEQAAAVPIAAYTALQGLRDKGQIKSRQKVLINGAWGRRGHVCGADCQIVRGRSDGRVQHEERRHGPIDRRRPRHRLHPRRL